MALSSDTDISFYGTLGKGLENLTRVYLTRRLFGALMKKVTNCDCSVVDYAEGKLIFRCPYSIVQNFRDVLEKADIKFFERLFVLVDRKFLTRENETVNTRILIDEIYSILLNSDSISEKIGIWKILRNYAEKSDQETMSFRLSVKCTGKWRRKIDVTRLCESLGPKIAEKMHWRIDLRRPEVEISVRVSDSFLFVGLPLTKDPLSIRPYIVHMSLRGSVCDGLVQLANLEPGNLVLDPMCGQGTILFEAAAQTEGIAAIGIDLDQRQLSLAQENLAHFEKKFEKMTSIAILPGDARRLPFKDRTFDRVISDIPFGQQHSTKDELEILYPSVIREMFRVLKRRRGCRIVLLTSTDSCPLLRNSYTDVIRQMARENADGRTTTFEETSKIDISLGETSGVIVVLEIRV